LVASFVKSFKGPNRECRHYGGHLLSIQDQKGYDRLANLVTGYPHPVIIGGRSDGAGNWEWSDGSNFDLTFMQAHSGDMKDGAPNPIEGTIENKLVFYWGEAGYSSDPLHGIHDWGTLDDGQPMAFACSATGTKKGAAGALMQAADDAAAAAAAGGGH
jgi:hypothetical protein